MSGACSLRPYHRWDETTDHDPPPHTHTATLTLDTFSLPFSAPRAVRRQSGAKVCSTSGQGRCARARARKRTGPLEFGERVPPKFDQQFDPFGESIYNASDYWEASFYNEPDETPVEVYVDSKSTRSLARAPFPHSFPRVKRVSSSADQSSQTYRRRIRSNLNAPSVLVPA